MINGLSIVQSSWCIVATNQSSTANLRCNSSLHALSLNHFESLIFGHFKSSPWRHSRANRRASHFWTHIWCHPVRTVNGRWVHRIWKQVCWTLWHATNLVLGLVKHRKHVGIGVTHLNHVLVGSLHLLRWPIVLLILSLKVVKLQLLLLLIKTHLLTRSLPVGFVLGQYLVRGRHLVAVELLSVVMSGLDSSLRLAGVVGTERGRSLLLLLVHL